MIVLVIIGVVGVVLLGWITYAKTNCKDLDSILDDIDFGLFVQIDQLLEGNLLDREASDRLVRRIGLNGLITIWLNTGAFLSILSYIANRQKSMRKEYDAGWWTVLRIRKLVWRVALENTFSRIFKTRPRFSAIECARLYCELCEEVSIILGTFDTNASNRFSESAGRFEVYDGIKG